MAAWLVKSEPSEYSFADLEREGPVEWDGVKNPTAQINLRGMQAGDTCVIYHSMSEKAAVGIARVVRAPYPDPTDPAGKRVWVDLQAERRLARPVTLKQLKAEPDFADSPLVRISRLSVSPLTDVQLAIIERLGG
ncbi:MAG: EVE domain-containing protein [Chloroflexi bacterium]|nr:EVE domain-containing protein [Chloroflexota bacterium]